MIGQMETENFDSAAVDDVISSEFKTLLSDPKNELYLFKLPREVFTCA